MMPFLFTPRQAQGKSAKPQPLAVRKKTVTAHKRRRPSRLPSTTIEIRKSPARAARPVRKPPLERKRQASDTLSINLDTSDRTQWEKQHGFFQLQAEKEREDAKQIATNILSQEDAWLKRVVKGKLAGAANVPKANGWSLFKERFFSFSASPKPDKTKPPVLTKKERKELESDTFLQHVEKKNPASVVGTVVDVKEAKTEHTSEEPTQTQPEAAAPAPKPRKAEHRPKNGFQQFLAALGHIGMGKERMHFTENLAMMLKAGLPLVDSLKTLQLETRSRSMKKLLQKLLDSVENGSPLWRAMEDRSFFSLHALALVRIGEEAGNLAENVEYLAAQEEKDHELRGKVKMAMIYPSIVLTLMFIIVMGLGMFVLPNLIGVLYSLNVPLPLVTRVVIIFSNFFTQHGTFAVPATIGSFILFIILAKFTPLKVVVQWGMFKIPGIGALARQATIARFGVILGGLLKAGVPVIEAMQSLVDVTPILAYRRLYQKMLDHITVGDSFSKSFTAIRGSQRLLPPSVQQLVITGERSGSLSEIMLKIADIYDKKASETAQKLPVILEPILLIFIGGLVGTIAFAIIIPIYSIVGNVGGR